MTMIVGHLREQIDAIDAQLLDLLNRRAEISLELGRQKREAGLGIRDERREAQILTRAHALNSGPLEPEAVERLFRAILAESCRAQSNQDPSNRAQPAHAESAHARSRRAARPSQIGRMQCL
jgi:chorismate mutase / prephenate dehydratase